MTDIYQVYAAELEKRTGGRVKVTIFPAQALGKSVEYYDMILGGVVDFADTSLAYYPGRSQLMDAFTLPFLIPPDSEDKNGRLIEDVVWWDYVIPLELTDVKIPWTKCADPCVVHSDRPIRTLEDMKGLLVGIPGGKSNPAIVKALGASPEVVKVPDMYTALERSMIDAMWFPLSAQVSFRLHEVTKYATMVNTGAGPHIQLMSLKTFNSFPPDIQKIVEDMKPWISQIHREVQNDELEHTKQFAKSQGIELIDLAPEELQRWVNATAGIEKDWAAEMDAAGLPGTQLVEEIHRLVSGE